jgi:hypothetical protein
MNAFRPSYAVIIVALLSGGLIAWIFFHPAAVQKPGTNITLPAGPQTTPAPGVNITLFKEDTLRFYFDVPDGYSAYEYPPQNGEIVIAVGSLSGSGMLLLIDSVSGNQNAAVSADAVESVEPGKPVQNARAVTIGGATGLAFDSTNTNLNGASHEIWLVHEGKLYRLAVRAGDADLLSAIANTWTFEK